jgi:hypothetical protein
MWSLRNCIKTTHIKLSLMVITLRTPTVSIRGFFISSDAMTQAGNSLQRQLTATQTDPQDQMTTTTSCLTTTAASVPLAAGVSQTTTLANSNT